MGAFKSYLEQIDTYKQQKSENEKMNEKVNEKVNEDKNRIADIKRKGFSNLNDEERSWLFRNYPKIWDELMKQSF